MAEPTSAYGPPCADDCRATLRAFAEKSLRGVEVILTWAPPLFRSGYEPLNLRCPHGVLWFMEPTADGRAQLEAMPPSAEQGADAATAAKRRSASPTEGTPSPGVIHKVNAYTWAGRRAECALTSEFLPSVQGWDDGVTCPDCLARRETAPARTPSPKSS